MARQLSKDSLMILRFCASNGSSSAYQINQSCNLDSKKLASALYRLVRNGYLKQNSDQYVLTKAAQTQLQTKILEPAGYWNIIVFDIPESQRPIRDYLRTKLTALNFQRWQNSIWISPYLLAPEVEKELAQLATQYFIRLIKTTQINRTDDLEQLFKQ